MRELNIYEIQLVSGAVGYGTECETNRIKGGMGDQSICHSVDGYQGGGWYGRGLWDFGPASVVGGLIGNFFGPGGAAVGTGLGHAFETQDWDEIARERTEYIERELKQGHYVPD